MSTLILILPGDWPQQRRDCPWQIHDAAGRLLRQGCSEPAQWPKPPTVGDDPPACILLLAGRQVAGRRQQLPAPPLGHRPEVVAAALEDLLLDAPSPATFAVDPRSEADGSSRIGVVAHSRLAALVALVRELGWSPQAAWPLGMAATGAGAWVCGDTLCAVGDRGFVELACDDSLGDWLDLVAPGQTLPLTALDPAPARDLRLQQLARFSQTPVPLRPPPGHGFLHGELAPPRRPPAWARHFAPAARLAAASAALLCLVSAVQLGWHAWQARQLRASIAAHFRAALPQVAMVDPVRQLAQQLATARRATGQLAADDFLALAETLGDVAEGGLQLHEVDYHNGQLQVRGQLAAEAAAQLASAAAQRGQRLQMPTAANGQFTLSAGDGS